MLQTISVELNQMLYCDAIERELLHNECVMIVVELWLLLYHIQSRNRIYFWSFHLSNLVLFSGHSMLTTVISALVRVL